MQHQADAPPKPPALQTDSNYMHETRLLFASFLFIVFEECFEPFRAFQIVFVHTIVLFVSNCVATCKSNATSHVKQLPHPKHGEH